MLPDAEKVERCLNYLAKTDTEIAGLKAAMKAEEHMQKHYRSMAMASSSAKSVAAKEVEYYASTAYRDSIERYQNIVADYETLHARRATAMLTIDVWRTAEASRRNA